MVLDNGGVMCITCGKSLSSIGVGNRHVRETHRPNQKAQCRICKKFYKNERQLNNHYKSVHGISGREMKNVVKVPNLPTSHHQQSDPQPTSALPSGSTSPTLFPEDLLRQELF